MATESAEQVPINVTGSSVFGIYPKINLEKTVNMFISEDWLCNYAGYKLIRTIATSGEGRGLFHSVRGNFMLAVINNTVYYISSSLTAVPVSTTLDTTSGEVSMDENNAQQICIVDGSDAYIFHYTVTNPTIHTLTKQNLPGSPYFIIPNYVSFHNTFFLIGSALTSINPQLWYAFTRATDITISLGTTPAQRTFEISTKPDRALAVERLPGKGNNVLVLGQSVSEVWQQVGGTQNYSRATSYNIDYGCVSVNTIASNEDLVCWLGQNENNSPVILTSNGAQTNRISTDGIDHLLESIEFPQDSTAFFYRQNGHLFYHLTFFNTADNLSLLYDFNTEQFYHASDENQNFYPARQVAYFDGNEYFVSLSDASLYQIGQQFITYKYTLSSSDPGEEIPRIRICRPLRKEDSSIFRVGMFTFWIEQGVNNWYNTGNTNCDGFLITENTNQIIVTEGGDPILSQQGLCFTDNGRPRVDMSFSKTGNQTFSNIVGRELNQQAKFRNQIRWHRMGFANEFTIQLRFWGFQRFVTSNGVAEVY